jgi:hypothetical protein
MKIVRHWPEYLLVTLFFSSGALTMIFVPVHVVIKLALVPVSWVLAFGVWSGIVWISCKFQNKSN